MPHKVTKLDQQQFKKALAHGGAEKDIEKAYRDIFEKYYGGIFKTVHSTDGYLEPDANNLLSADKNSLRLLLEAKWHKNFDDGDRYRLIAQTIYYLKKFELAGDFLPNVILGGDENEMFVIYTPKVYKYLERDYDWNIPPSSAFENEELLRELIEDENLRDIFVFSINNDFDIKDVFDTINALCQNGGELKPLHVDEANLRKVFDEFVRLVFGNDEWLAGVRKLGATEAVSIFVRSILGNENTYLHPNKPNILMNEGKAIRINGAKYRAFFSRYDRDYTVKEIDSITAIADQLIKEIERRFHGDFWTPTIWADRAIQMMTEDLGEDWKEEYYVWDPAAGTKNLTRDYKFKHLFSSTLHQSEIDMSSQYNKEAISFQYDFLNDDIDVNPNSDPRDLKMPRELFEALKADKPIVFYTNPPYGQASEQGSSSKAGVADTKIQKIMKKVGLGVASSELYTQFIYRVQKLARDFNLSNIFFFFFNKGFLVGPSFKKFSDQLLGQFEFNDGFMLNAGEFQGTSSNWGIIFSNFENKKNNLAQQTNFEFSVEKSSIDGVENIGSHILRRVADKETLSAWLKEIKISNKEYNNGLYPRITGGYKLSVRASAPRGYYRDGSYGFIQMNGYNVQYCDKYTAMNSSMIAAGDVGVCVTRENFERACVTFACRKSILPDASWINDKDVFRRPSDEFQNSPEWKDFIHDCVVFSLFHRSSYQTALRDFEYNGEYYDVKNEWFFMPKAEIIELAEKNKLNEIVFDARNSEERFVYKYLHNDNGNKISLSAEARELLLAGEDFVRVCFAKRFITDQDHPEWHLMTWDAGYYQSYKIYTENKKDKKIAGAYSRLDSARTKLETKIRKQVYKDGILSK